MPEKPTYYIFPNTEYRDHYREKLYSRSFLYEWGIVIRDVEKYLSGIYNLLKTYVWEMLTKLVPQPNMEVVWEFYVNLPMLDWSMPLPTIRVWGKKVPMDVFTINDTLDVPNPSNATFVVRIWASDLEWMFGVLAVEVRAVEVK